MMMAVASARGSWQCGLESPISPTASHKGNGQRTTFIYSVPIIDDFPLTNRGVVGASWKGVLITDRYVLHLYPWLLASQHKVRDIELTTFEKDAIVGGSL